MFSSCSDPCKNVECNNGLCLEGTCLCNTGYTGSDCSTEVREVYLGLWKSDSWVCDGDGDDATLLISKGTSILELNVLAEGSNLIANIEGDEIIFLDQTIIDGGETVNLSGNASILNNELTLKLLVNLNEPNSEPYYCVGVFKKQ